MGGVRRCAQCHATVPHGEVSRNGHESVVQALRCYVAPCTAYLMTGKARCVTYKNLEQCRGSINGGSPKRPQYVRVQRRPGNFETPL